MKIEKKDVLLIVDWVLCGFILLFIVISVPVTASATGIPNGALGSCSACLLRNLKFRF
jgi:hypothetical protein